MRCVRLLLVLPLLISAKISGPRVNVVKVAVWKNARAQVLMRI